MIHKTCPWCENKMTLNQLGSRPKDQINKWYQFSRNIKVCPYCAEPVKLGGSAMKLVYLIIPIFGFTFLEVFFEISLANYWYIGEITWGLAVIGLIGVYIFSIFEKA